jgi:hypothetical protein
MLQMAIQSRHSCIGILIFINVLSVKGQDYEKYFSKYIDFVRNDTSYTFLDKNLLKAKPAENAKTIAVLSIGEEIVIDSTYTEADYSPDMVKPSYYKVKHKDKTGYLKSESLALTRLNTQKSETYFLFKLNSHKDSTTSSLTIREVNLKVIAGDFNAILQGEMFMLHITDSKGLDSVDHLIVVDYIAEACGVEGGMTYFTWTSKNIRLLAHLSSIGDAGVFSINERLIFPADSGGIKGKLVFKSEIYELLDEETNWVKETLEERTYLWVAGKIVPEFNSKPKEDY